MNLYLRVLSYVKPYRIMVLLSFVSSLLFVFFNTFSFWMISTLISTIMNPGGNDTQIQQVDLTINDKLENIVQQLIGSGSQLDQLEKLSAILIITFLFKNVFFFINNIRGSNCYFITFKNIITGDLDKKSFIIYKLVYNIKHFYPIFYYD